jgi:hypothetical protein
MTSPSRWTFAAALALASCATSATSATSADRASFAYSAQTGELEAAAPATASEGRANTAVSASVALGGRRERVRDAVDTYLRAVLDGDVDRAVAWFSDPINLVDNDSRYRTVEELANHHRTAVGSYDMSFLRLELERESGAPIVRSAAEFRRVQPTRAVSVQSGDWVVDLPFVVRAPYTSVARYLPSRIVIRFVGNTARAVAVSAILPLRT